MIHVNRDLALEFAAIQSMKRQAASWNKSESMRVSQKLNECLYNVYSLATSGRDFTGSDIVSSFWNLISSSLGPIPESLVCAMD